MSWLTEFGAEFEVPVEILNVETIVDISWRNDACPSFTDESETVKLWVNHPDQGHREVGDWRFAITYWVEPEESGDPYSGYAESYTGNDVNEAIRQFIATVQERRGRTTT